MTEGIKCAKAVFDAADYHIKCSIDGRIVEDRCQKCVQYTYTDQGIPVINRRRKK